jgi:hypothetical protein
MVAIFIRDGEVLMVSGCKFPVNDKVDRNS